MNLFDQYLESEIIFRLRQEGYILLLILLFVFTVSILLSNIVAQLLSWSIQFLSYIETAEIRPLRRRKIQSVSTQAKKFKK